MTASAEREELADGDGATVKRRPADDEEGSEGAGAVRVTDRDRDILGLLVLARYLTASQVHRLAFDGKNLSLAYRRLTRLASAEGHQPFARQRFFRTYEGNRIAVWAPTAYALAAALSRSPQLPELPKHDVGAQFLEHLIQLNELFVALWRSGSRCPRATHPALRWIPSDRVRLTWGEWEMREGRKQQRVIQPDAVLEVLPARRRFFLECEMGTQPISPGESNAQGATLNKAERYHTFLSDLSSDGRRTHYGAQYPDTFAPEVLFLVLSDGRASSVNRALKAWAKEDERRRRSTLRALTFEAAIAELRGLAGLAGAEQPVAPAPATSETPSWTPPFPQSQARALARVAREALQAIQGARRQVRKLPEDVRNRHGLAEPAYPEGTDKVYALVERLAREGWL